MIENLALQSKIKNQKSKIAIAPVMSQGVFAINFVRQQVPSIGLRRVVAIGTVGALAANLVALIVLAALAMQLRQQEQAVRARLSASGVRVASLEAAFNELRPLQGRAAGNLAELRHIVDAQRARVPLSGTLAALAATLPPRTWIATLAGNRADRALTIEAVYVIDPAAPTDLPMKAWIDALKADPRFSDGLHTLELASSSRATQGRAELMRFTLVAMWALPASEIR